VNRDHFRYMQSLSKEERFRVIQDNITDLEFIKMGSMKDSFLQSFIPGVLIWIFVIIFLVSAYVCR
jgi:hypothetical protein